MFGGYVYIFFEGDGKEAIALELKDFLEELLGEAVGVGRALERPWEDSAATQRRRGMADAGEPGSEAPWSFARSVFSYPTYEAHFRSLDPEAEAIFEDETGWAMAGPFEEDELEEEDESLYLFGSDMPQQWRDAPLILCFPPFALPAGTAEERRASRPKARKLLRLLRSRSRKSRLTVQLSASFEGPEFLDLREVTAARLLAMSIELDAAQGTAASPGGSLDAALDLALELEDPELHWQEPKDRSSWPAKLWRRLSS